MKKIELMYYFFGHGEPSVKCATCKHLIRHRINRSYFKCECYGDTSSEASDWRKSYPSCGLYNKPYNGNPIIEVKKHMSRGTRPKDDVQIEGQISLGDIYGI